MAEMRLVGSRFTKIDAFKDGKFSGKLSLKTGIDVGVIEKVKSAKDTVEIPYTFGVYYGDLGRVVVHGVLFVSGDSKTVKEVLKMSKEKNFDSKEHLAITNIILQKASVKALELEEELGLPFHIKLPSLSPKQVVDDS